VSLDEAYEPTIEDSFSTNLRINGQVCNLQIVDSSGDLNYASQLPFWISENHGYLIVYSTSCRASLMRASKLLQVLRDVASKRPTMLVGNRLGTSTTPEVYRDEGLSLSRDYGCLFVETCARTGDRVEKAFFDPVCLLRGVPIQDDNLAADAPRQGDPTRLLARDETLVADTLQRGDYSGPLEMWHAVRASLARCWSPRRGS
jgi:GTPase KRas protein